MMFPIEDEVEFDLLERALVDRIQFSSTYVPEFSGESGDDPLEFAETFEEVVASHREDAITLEVMLQRLRMLAE